MKSINIALIAILLLASPIFAAEDAYATVCHGKHMRDNKFGEFVMGEVKEFYDTCLGDFTTAVNAIVAKYPGEESELKKKIKETKFYNGTDLEEKKVEAENIGQALFWCAQLHPINMTDITPKNISDVVWKGIACDSMVKLTEKYLNITDKDECWKSIKKIHNNRCYWRWNEYLFGEQRDYFETVRDEVHSIDWLYLFMVIIGSVIGSFLLTLILGLIMNIVKKKMHKKAE